MLDQLDRNLRPGGLLFIRMTSDIGLTLDNPGNDGVFLLPDNTKRYLISRVQVDELLKKCQYILEEPVKTVNVDGLRSMTTLVFRKK